MTRMTRQRQQQLVRDFQGGTSVTELATLYTITSAKVEAVLREALRTQKK